jgi:hypothetical protein
VVVPGHPFEYGFDLRLVPEKLGDSYSLVEAEENLRQFYERPFPRERTGRIHREGLRVMLAANWHTYQILTKRADRMTCLLRGKFRGAAGAPHIWWV